MHKEIGTLLIWGAAILGAVDVSQLGLDIPGDVIAAGMFVAGTYLVSVKG